MARMVSNFGPRRAIVRWAFSDEATWREPLGSAFPLHPCSTVGPLDAPDNMPAGAARSTPSGKPAQVVTVRPGSILW